MRRREPFRDRPNHGAYRGGRMGPAEVGRQQGAHPVEGTLDRQTQRRTGATAGAEADSVTFVFDLRFPHGKVPVNGFKSNVNRL